MTPEELNSLAWDVVRNALILAVICAFILKVDWWSAPSAKLIGPKANYLVDHPLLHLASFYLWFFFCDAVTRDFFPGWGSHGTHSIAYRYLSTLISAVMYTIVTNVLWRRMRGKSLST